MHRNESYSPPAVKKLFACVLILTLFGCGDPVKPAEVQSQPPEKEQPKIKEKEKVILCFGNSLTEGYGLKPEESYPSLLQNRIDSLGLNYRVVNAGVSGETTAGGKSRLGWVLKKKVDIFVLELGANDGLRGIPIEETKICLLPKIVLAFLTPISLTNFTASLMSFDLEFALLINIKISFFSLFANSIIDSVAQKST